MAGANSEIPWIIACIPDATCLRDGSGMFPMGEFRGEVGIPNVLNSPDAGRSRCKIDAEDDEGEGKAPEAVAF